MVEWLNAIVGWLALVIATLAWRQGAWLRQRDMALKLNGDILDLSSKLAMIAQSAPDLRASWRAVLAKEGSLNSGAMLQREQQIEKMLSETNRMRQQLGAIKRKFGFWEFRKVETSVRELQALIFSRDTVLRLHSELEEDLQHRLGRK